MTAGFGAGFVAITIGATLLAIASVLAVLLVATHILDAGHDLQRIFQYIAVALLGAVLAITAFTIVAFIDEAPAVATLFAVVVAIPVFAVGIRTRFHHHTWRTTAATAALAWSVPFLVGVAVFLFVVSATDLPPAITTGVLATVVTAGTLIVGTYLTNRVPPIPQ